MNAPRELTSRMGSADETAMQRAQDRWDSLAKPVGGLGMLEDLVVRLAGIMGTDDVWLPRRELVVACTDNGVVAHGVSASDASVTRAMARALGLGTSTACHMARSLNCTVIPVDVGMFAGESIPGVLPRSVRPGADDIASGPAMSSDECRSAIGQGMELVRTRKQAGVSILLAGEMGIGNTTTSCAVASALLGLTPSEVVGPGTGLSSEGVANKVAVIERALEVNQPNPDDPIDVLHKVGGLDIAFLCGICLGGALHRMPILLDGIITLAAAACAVHLCPECRYALLASHVSAEPAAPLLLDEIGLEAPLHAQMHLGEGTGALAALPLLDVALEVYRNGHTLDQLSIDGYKPWQEEG